ncbi:MAG: hypothetical protein NTW59_00610 [Candidatus Diapherotrites archaeon]|nr:hypothetical protein [Candidatus Diapherotrites archaeon]
MVIIVMMVLKKIVSGLFKVFHRLEAWSGAQKGVYGQEAPPSGEEPSGGLHSVWDYLRFRENTQAFHISGVLGFEEWVGMDEIRRRVREIFGVEYKNERSLYPYLKTLGDMGLVENSDAGGRRQWRKKDVLIKIVLKSGEKEAVAEEAAKVREQKKQRAG